MEPLIIGVGNPDRGDDGAGPAVIRQLTGMRTSELRDCSALIDTWSGEHSVVVVDAMQSGGTPGSVMTINAATETMPTQAFRSTHSFGLAESIELAKALNRMPVSMTIYGIEAASFERGSPLSAAVAVAVDNVAKAIQSDWI